MNVLPVRTRIFTVGENLVDFIVEHIPEVPEGAILVITSKIAALAENRQVPIESKEQKVDLIKQESELAIPSQVEGFPWLTIKDGFVMASAGIDESNADGSYYILLPKDSHQVAHDVRQALLKRYGRRELGTIVTDSRVMPLRRGTLGAAYGYAGFRGLRDYVGKPDIFGRPFKMSKSNIPDSLATAAVVCMGEGDERQPLALITDFPADFTNEPIDRDELKIPLEEDLYGPLFRSLEK
jgi:F420-0:gamma-glutamyl ligase